jgi:glutamate 5-kinase
MITKVIAAKRAARSGAHTVIASGRASDVMLRLARGEPSARCWSPKPRRSPRASNGSPTTCS